MTGVGGSLAIYSETLDIQNIIYYENRTQGTLKQLKRKSATG